MTENTTETDEGGGEGEGEEEVEVHTDHLEDIDDGCGCAEVWEHTSERRESDTAADD